jgi:hypothetical protein
MINSQFWPTVALAMPVLALAIVVEARATISRWSDFPPRWLRAWQSLLWVAPLILFAYLEPVAFGTLEGSKAPHIAIALVIPTISLSISALILAPAVELLMRSNARVVIRTTAFLATGKMRWRERSSLRMARRLARRVKIQRADALENLAKIRLMEAQVESWGHPECDECQSLLNDCANIRDSVTAQRKEAEEAGERIQELLKQAIDNRKSFKEVEGKYISDMTVQLTQFNFDDTKLDALEKAVDPEHGKDQHDIENHQKTND